MVERSGTTGPVNPMNPAPAGAGEPPHGHRIIGQPHGLHHPNRDRELPMFAARKFGIISQHPGFLFNPRERYHPNYIPSRKSRCQTPNRM